MIQKTGLPEKVARFFVRKRGVIFEKKVYFCAL